jgi:hypothetical protein
MALSALSLPGELQRFMDRAARGEIELGVRNLDESARLIYHAGQQLLWGMLAATAAVLATVFDGRGQHRATWIAAIASGLGGLFLIGGWFAGHPRRPRNRR